MGRVQTSRSLWAKEDGKRARQAVEESHKHNEDIGAHDLKTFRFALSRRYGNVTEAYR